MRRSPPIAIVLALGAAGACGSSTTIAAPNDVLGAYRSAVAEHDYATAYSLLSAETRAALPYPQFEAQLRRDESATATRLRALARVPATTTATATIAIENESVSLVLEDGSFRIVGNPADAFDQTSPRGAARAFALALSAHRADWLLALAPPEARALLDATTVERALASDNASVYAELADSVAASLNAPIEQNGSLASLPIGSDRILRLVRVSGLWYVDGID